MNQILDHHPTLLADQRAVPHPLDAAIAQMQRGGGVIILDDADRENEGDLIFAAGSITDYQMAQLIRDCSGIVCLVLTEDRCRALDLPPMVPHNNSRYGTGFTVSIEARVGVTTGVSAADRVTTIKAAIADTAQPGDLSRPGHVFPLMAHPDGVLGRRGHTEATIDLLRLAGLKPAGVLCELMRDDGSMATLADIKTYAARHSMPVIQLEDIVQAVTFQDSYIKPSKR